MRPVRRESCRFVLFLLLPLILAGCADDGPSWAARNKQVIDEHKITGRTRELPPVSIPTVLTDGEPVERARLPVITIAPGVTAALGVERSCQR